jgi:thymidylate synthase (FAD)
MEVNLVYTSPEPERYIVECARVSSTRKDKTEDQVKLINYLIRNKHWSPFEMSSMVVEIVTSRAIAQQILRHRSFSFQEFSQRYAEVTEFEPVQLRRQAEKNRQSSTKYISDPYLNQLVAHHIDEAEALYQYLLDRGVAKECARMVLPLTTQTRLYMQGTCRSWIHYLQVRTDPHTQKEHRDIALAIQKIFAQEFPLTARALGIQCG